MKHKDKLFRLLRTFAETPQESIAVEEMIRKIDGNLPTVEIVDESHQKFNGITYAASQKEGRYFKMLTLSRMVWTYFNGEIPEGYDIHHVDGNKDNNDISNLQALPKRVHNLMHAQINGKKTCKTIKTFVCVNCGKEYTAANSGHNLYCSQACLVEYRNNVLYSETRQCQYCGKEFSAYKYGHQKFCSYQCSIEYVKHNSGTEIRHCAYCGKEIVVVKHELNRHKYCSVECQREGMKNRVTKECLICGKQYSVKASKDKRSKYCSRQCANEAIRRRMLNQSTRNLSSRQASEQPTT